MTLVLDAGAFLAVERLDREIISLIKRERLAERAPLTHGGVVAQVWRGGSGRQAEVARVLRSVQVVPLDVGLGRRAGMLLGRSGLNDVVDSALICLANDGDRVLTSDPDDLRVLAEAADLMVELTPV